MKTFEVSQSTMLCSLLVYLLIAGILHAQQLDIVLSRQSVDVNMVTLTCRSAGLPLPQAQFWVNVTSDNHFISGNEGTYSFKIDKMSEGEYFCGLIETNLSPKIPVIVFPKRDLGLAQTGTIPVRMESGTTAILKPRIPPGNWLSRYYIDWRRLSPTDTTVARVDGLRILSPLVSPERYSVRIRDFSLLIQEVSRSDAGIYVGVLGVSEEESASRLTYDQTENELNISLLVYERPIITQSPTDKVIQYSSETSQGSVNFTCTSRGYPRPTITWYHKSRRISPFSENYKIYSVNSGDDTVTSTLVKTDIAVDDSGTFGCMATVEPGGDIIPINSMMEMADLSVLQIADAEVYLTVTGEIFINVFLTTNVSAELRLRFTFHNLDDTNSREIHSTTVYRDVQEMSYLVQRGVTFPKFTVDIVVLHKNTPSIAVQRRATFTQDIENPCNVDHHLLLKVLVPTLGALVLLVIATIALPCIVMCYVKNNKTAKLKTLDVFIQHADENDRKAYMGVLAKKIGITLPSVTANADPTRSGANVQRGPPPLPEPDTRDYNGSSSAEHEPTIQGGPPPLPTINPDATFSKDQGSPPTWSVLIEKGVKRKGPCVDVKKSQKRDSYEEAVELGNGIVELLRKQNTLQATE